MTHARLRTVVGLAAATGILVALTACAPATTPTHTGAAKVVTTPSPTPTPTVSTLDTTAPTPLVALDCSRFVTTSELTAAFGGAAVVEIPTSSIATGDLEGQDTQIPAMDYVREAGGVACLWTDKPSNYYTTSFPTEHAEQVSVLFNAQTAWHNEEIVDQFPGDLNDGSCDIGACQLDQLVSGTTWIDTTELNQTSSHDPFGSIVPAAKAAVLSGGAAGAIPTPDTGTLALGSNCAAFIADSDATTALGAAVVSSQPLLPKDDFGYYGTWNGAQDQLKDHPCVWKHGATVVGHLSWLPGGAWAWNEAKVLPLKDGPVAPLAIPGIADGDTAFIRCAAADESCVADLVLGGNWIEAQVSQPGTTNRAAVTAIAASIVAKLG